MKVHRVIDRGDGSKLHQAGTVTEKDGKLILLVHGLAAVGKDAKPKTYATRDKLAADGWTEGA